MILEAAEHPKDPQCLHGERDWLLGTGEALSMTRPWGWVVTGLGGDTDTTRDTARIILRGILVPRLLDELREKVEEMGNYECDLSDEVIRTSDGTQRLVVRKVLRLIDALKGGE
jgi:hypothetical protein